MSAAAAQLAPRFVRRTTLAENEYRVNFKQIDNDVIKALTSPEAREVTPMVSAIYLSLLASPPSCWERDGVLHFVGEDREEGRLTAWEQMREIAGVANSTLSKAMDWMSRTGVIGYDARANGVGIRVFFNRASSSIRARPGQKNLRLVPTPSNNAPTPTNGAPFKEVCSESNRDNYFSRAFAREESSIDKKQPVAAFSNDGGQPTPANLRVITDQPIGIDAAFVTSLTRHIASELRPEIAAAVKRETDGARDWFLKYGLPKATRVAQRETYDLLRSQGVIAKKSNSGDVGRYDKAAEQGREGKSEIERIAAFLAENSRDIRQAATATNAPRNAELCASCHTASGELDNLRDRIIAGEKLAIDGIDGSLEAVEHLITEAMWGATDKAELESMLKLARDEMQGYAARMERKDFDETVRRRVTARLRDRHGIPRISLFYA